MKKTISLILTAMLTASLLLVLSACGSDSSSAADAPAAPAADSAPAAESAAAVDVTGTYVHEFPSTISDKETVQITLTADGKASVSMPDNALNFVFNGTYTNDGTTVSLQGVKEDEPKAGEGYPGFEWSLSWIDAAGNGQIIVDTQSGTYDIIELPESQRREAVVASASLEPSGEPSGEPAAN